MDDQRELLETILVAEVLALGRAIKAEKASKGTFSTSDYTYEAVSEIKRKRESIIKMLAEN